MLACGPCWRLLPYDLQRAVIEADAERRHHRSSAAHAIVHRRVVGEALAWYRANTTKEPRS